MTKKSKLSPSLRYYYNHHEQQKEKYRKVYHIKKANDVAGVYRIKNTLNGKYYIGSSEFINNRLREHRNDLRRNKHSNPHLQNAWNLYGEDKFEFTILEVLPVTQIVQAEQIHIDTIPTNLKYNINMQAGRTVLKGDQNGMFGKHHSLKTRQHWSRIRTGQRTDPRQYTFRNHETHVTFTGTRYQFLKKYPSVSDANLSRLVRGLRATCNQWILIS